MALESDSSALRSLISQNLSMFAAAFVLSCIFLAKYVIKWTETIELHKRNRYFSRSPAKTSTEVLFMSLSICWISMFAIIIGTGVYHDFKRWEYLLVCFPMAAVYAFVPWLLGFESSKPLFNRYYVKANVWIAILTYVGNFYWTHYFYNLLGAKYTFDAHRLNDVPISMYFATHAYFCFYHSMTNIMIRWVRTSQLYVEGTSTNKMLIDSTFIGFIAYTTAFMETKTIEGFQYWEFVNRDRALIVGSMFYMIYFIVSFPMFLRLDEPRLGQDKMWTRRSKRFVSETAAWPMTRVIWDSLASCMLVTIILDFWRLTVGAVY